MKKFNKILAANRSEIAIRIFRAATELGISTVAIYSHEDRYALHRFKADEAYKIGEGNDPIKAYLDIDNIIKLALEKGVDAIHPGYGFLSENAEFARKCAENGITFIGPSVDILESLGSKTSAKKMALEANVPVLSGALGAVKDERDAIDQADRLGYPVIIKASHGGGGRGMRAVAEPEQLLPQLSSAKSESLAAFGSDEVFIEKFIESAKHIEVQILGDEHGNVVYIYDRDCSLQRRHQKIIEIAPSISVHDDIRKQICDAAVRICQNVKYSCAGTVEFLLDTSTNKFYFIEVNPRIQVEHTVTEVVTGLDIVKRQILVAQGYRLDSDMINISSQDDISISNFAFQCRITTEDPQNNFIPDYGKIEHYRSTGGIGIRLDAGTAFSGAIVTPYYDSMLVKITASGDSFRGAIQRMTRALSEFRIRGVKTNIPFLLNLIQHPDFAAGDCTTSFIDDNPQLFDFELHRDRATKLLKYIGEVVVNGHPQINDSSIPVVRRNAPVAHYSKENGRPDGWRDILVNKGAEALSQAILNESKVLLTDTTMRDAHQSHFATRMRTYDMKKIAERYSYAHADFFSVEMWGGATFDVSMRFLNESPWERLRQLRAACPNLLFQMLLRASNAVGYKNYPDNLVSDFIKRSADEGMDIFRIFDSLNWVDNMKFAIEETLKTGAVAETAICYTGDILNPDKTKYTLDYYVKMARELEAEGAHIIAIKDMAGLLKPYAAQQLISALKSELKIPLHLHTHDTCSGQMATLIKAAEAGCDIIDGAFGPLSGTTSQPNLNTLVEHLRYSDRDTNCSFDELQKTSEYWAVVREYYNHFESPLKYGAADVYNHEMPGGQYTNLFQQACSLGLADRWFEVCDRYAEVNALFGDIVKVTPSSKVVGDMALMLVTNNLSAEDIKSRDIAFPQSVVDMMAGYLGQPLGGWPADIQKIVLRDNTPFTDRPTHHLQPIDFANEKEMLAQKLKRPVTDLELCSYLLYPEVFEDYVRFIDNYSDVSILPTPVFFHGLEQHEEVAIELDKGKTLYLRLVAISPENHEGDCNVFFELNGHPRAVTIKTTAGAEKSGHQKADEDDPLQIAAPMPGMISTVLVKAGDEVEKGTPLFVMEAMKMETTISAECKAKVLEVLLPAKESVKVGDLIMRLGCA